MKKFIVLFFVLAVLGAQSFPTAMGDCQLHFVSDDRETLLDLTELITDQINRHLQEYGVVEKRPFTVYVASSEKEFNELSRGYAPEWSIAIAQSRHNRIVILSPAISKISMAQFRKVVIHEINHLYLHRIPNFDVCPAWYVEGLAMRSASELSLIQKINISKARWNQSLIPLSKLSSMRVRRNWEINQAYGQSAAAVYAMQYYYGEDIHYAILDLLRSDQNGFSGFEQILEKLTGDDILDFQEKYDQYIRQNYNWMFLLRASNFVFAALPVILVAGYLIKRKKNRKKLQLWELEEELDQLTPEA